MLPGQLFGKGAAEFSMSLYLGTCNSAGLYQCLAYDVVYPHVGWLSLPHLKAKDLIAEAVPTGLLPRLDYFYKAYH